ncbi:unnamed protein product [Prunus armeniaca]|uniref:Uncharacterized protein n=1 Tax=Prunus armeniaca TaxID=36596 RepID=A0A6J5X465_PRUAR|nr:unnamed protein product [Prunus armeniaca]
MLIASAITTLSAIPEEEESFNEENNTDAKDETKNQFGKSTSLRSRFLSYSKCGTKCNYSEICCEGKCVNPSRTMKTAAAATTRARKALHVRMECAAMHEH